ncbi:hypothetical protein A6A40_19655 (plasmid) [Azospirillum humicireducens]|uniref:Uncharacterized protein n=1 Tax=Azospirillum humicireducens TaxID=1226968 RepID=A0A2R4VS47_9PROT|nr:hypothetical protein [Azospirillum humicireducens]AWB07269.1 hypothetical protein A6A40_19655 [Azospirillum humicireducens]
MRSMSRYHQPEDLIREHLRHAQAEADDVLRQAGAAAADRSVSFERPCAVGPLERLPVLPRRRG